jgi:hypothetical protein
MNLNNLPHQPLEDRYDDHSGAIRCRLMMLSTTPLHFVGNLA